MPGLNLSAILLRRIEFGDYDLIITFFSKEKGKITAIAKSAKKSVKRFGGVLEPFSELGIVTSRPKGKGLPILKEASLINPFFKIREDILKTAYASYWLELIYLWMAENESHVDLYHLTQHVLSELSSDNDIKEMLSILFQMRFMALAGFHPNFDECRICKTVLDNIVGNTVFPDFPKGGFTCSDCRGGDNKRFSISKGTLKQLLWIASGDLKRAGRIRFAPLALKQGLAFLEAFVPYHLGKEPKSLKVLRAVRR